MMGWITRRGPGLAYVLLMLLMPFQLLHRIVFALIYTPGYLFSEPGTVLARFFDWYISVMLAQLDRMDEGGR